MIEFTDDAITVQSVDGDSRLGGLDFDNRLMEQFIGKGYIRSPKGLLKLRECCEKAKEGLSIENDCRYA